LGGSASAVLVKARGGLQGREVRCLRYRDWTLKNRKGICPLIVFEQRQL
jgi:hypothetical protein